MFSRHEKQVLLLMFSINFLMITDFMALMPLGQKLMTLFDISAQKFSMMVAGYTLCAGLSGIVFSIFADRIPRKKALLGALSVFFVLELASLLIQDFNQLLLVRACIGAVVGITGALLFTVVSEVVPLAKRSTAIGIVLSAFALASILGVPLSLFIAQKFEWKFIFAFLASLAAVIGFAVAKFLPPIQQQVLNTQANIKKLVSHFAYSQRTLSFLFIIVLILGHFSVVPFLFPSIIANARYPEKDLPIIYLAGGLAMIVGSVLFGRLADKLGRKKIFAVTLLGSLIPIYLVSTMGPLPGYSVVAIVVFFFCLMGARMAPAMAIVSEMAPLSERGSFLSLINSFQQLAAAMGAACSGAIVIKATDGALINFEYVGYMAMGCSLLSLLIVSRLKAPQT